MKTKYKTNLQIIIKYLATILNQKTLCAYVPLCLAPSLLASASVPILFYQG